MDPSLSEDSSALPVQKIEDNLQKLYADNADLERSIEDKKKQIQYRRNVTAALVMERNWYLQVLNRIEEACKHDERLAPIQDVLKNEINE